MSSLAKGVQIVYIYRSQGEYYFKAKKYCSNNGIRLHFFFVLLEYIL